jgi:vanillin dehydrogenase
MPTSTKAGAAASFGAFMNQGQICMSTERIVAERPVARVLAERLAERAGQADLEVLERAAKLTDRVATRIETALDPDRVPSGEACIRGTEARSSTWRVG